jgi:3-hydroxyacyl-[acyl-carrier-protein] dehydratase
MIQTMITDYYFLNGWRTEGETAVFDVTLNPDSEVYRGHFPGKPVAPGVCNIQMIKELTERLTGCALRIDFLKQCRLTTLLTPQEHPDLEVHIRLLAHDGAQVDAQTSAGRGETTYLTLAFHAEVLHPTRRDTQS